MCIRDSPMPRDGTVLNFWWPLSNVDHARDLASAFTNAAAGLAQRTPRPQTLVQVAAQLAPALDIKGLIDRLVTHTHLRIAWEVDLQPGRDLLGAVFFLQLILHHLAQPLTRGELGHAGPASLPVGPFLRRRRPILRPMTILECR